MDDAGAMGRRQRRRHLTGDRQELGGRQAADSMKPLGERLAGQQLHGEKDDLVRRFLTTRRPMAVHVIDAADVRVRHLPCEMHFALEVAGSIVRLCAIVDRMVFSATCS